MQLLGTPVLDNLLVLRVNPQLGILGEAVHFKGQLSIVMNVENKELMQSDGKGN